MQLKVVYLESIRSSASDCLLGTQRFTVTLTFSPVEIIIALLQSNKCKWFSLKYLLPTLHSCDSTVVFITLCIQNVLYEL